jgi:hypothetical protein
MGSQASSAPQSEAHFFNSETSSVQEKLHQSAPQVPVSVTHANSVINCTPHRVGASEAEFVCSSRPTRHAFVQSEAPLRNG